MPVGVLRHYIFSSAVGRDRLVLLCSHRIGGHGVGGQGAGGHNCHAQGSGGDIANLLCPGGGKGCKAIIFRWGKAGPPSPPLCVSMGLLQSCVSGRRK